MYHRPVQRVWILVLTLSGCKGADAPAGESGDVPVKAPEIPIIAVDAPGKPPAAGEGPTPMLLEPLGELPDKANAPAKGDDAGEPPPAVVLPTAPKLPNAGAGARYDDGAWTIAGIRDELDEQVRKGDAGEEITLRGWVSQIYMPPSCPEGQVCPPAKQPHLWLTDFEGERGLRRALLVVNYAFTIPEWEASLWKDAPQVVLEVGRQYTLRGKVRRFSDSGFAHSDGLLEFVAYRPSEADKEWVYPPGASWHPIIIARQEEENRTLRERAKAGP